MRKKYTLIVPMLNLSSKYKDKLPIEFQYDNITGDMNCIKSIFGINLHLVTSIYFCILKEHQEKYHVIEKIMTEMKKHIGKLEYPPECIFVTMDPTSSQAETIYRCIKQYNIEGQILIKDADNMCIYDEVFMGNCVLVYPLESTPIVDPQHKSYISVDDQNFVTNIIEKRVISNLFNCGGYSFEDASDFVEGDENVQLYEEVNNHMYISNIIYWLILYKRLKFRPIQAEEYIDFELK